MCQWWCYDRFFTICFKIIEKYVIMTLFLFWKQMIIFYLQDWSLGLVTFTVIGISAPPNINLPSGTQRVDLGQRLILNCQASGTQPISFSWEKIDGPLSQYAVIRGGVLEISRVTPSDSGRYRCIAVNQAGRSEAYSDVQIYGMSSESSSLYLYCCILKQFL